MHFLSTAIHVRARCTNVHVMSKCRTRSLLLGNDVKGNDQNDENF